MKNERKVIVKFVETQEPLDLEPIARAFADMIIKNGLTNQQQANNYLENLNKNTTNQ